MSFTTQIDYVVTGLDKLNAAVSNLNSVSAAENKLTATSNDLSRQLNTLVSTGFDKLTKAVAELSSGFSSVNTSSASTNSSIKTLTSTTEFAVKSLSDLSAKLTTAKASYATMSAEIKTLTADMQKQAAAATSNAEKITYLATSSNKATKELRELFITQQAAAAESNIAATGYARVAALVAERSAAESGLSGVLAIRIAEEQALTAVMVAREAVDGIAIRNDQTRIISTSNLTNEQKIAAMASLGLIDANDELLKSTSAVTEAENKRLKGMAEASEAYAKVGKDHDVAIKANQLYAKELDNVNKKEAELLTGLNFANKGITTQSTSMTTLHGILRGVGASTGALALTYGALVPTVVAMAAAFVTVGTAIKSVKVGAEFDDMARYIEAIDVQAEGAEMSLGEIKSRLLEIKGVSQTPAELAEAVTNLAKAGISAEVAIASVADMSKFAAVVQTDLGEASKLVTSQWAAWGPASDVGSRGVSTMTELMNMLAVTVNESRAGMEDLQIAVKYLASLSGTTEATYSDLLAMAGVFANLGLEGSTGAAAARTALVKLQSAAGDTVAKFAEFGVIYDPFLDASKTKLKQGSDLLVEFFNAASQLSPSLQAEMIDTAIGIRGLSAAALVASGGMSQSFEDMKAAIETAADTAELKTSLINTMFEKLADGSVKKFAEMNAGIQRAMAEAFNSESVSASMDKIIEAVDSQGFKDVIGALAEATASFIAMLASISSVAAPGLGFLASKFRDIFEAINDIIAFIQNPENWSVKITFDIVTSLSEAAATLSNPVAAIGSKISADLGKSLADGVKDAFNSLTDSGETYQKFTGSLADANALFASSVKDSNTIQIKAAADLVVANDTATQKIAEQNSAATKATETNVQAVIRAREEEYTAFKALYTAEGLLTDEAIAKVAEFRDNQLNGADAVEIMAAAREKDAKAADTNSKAVDELTRANNDLAKAQVDAMPEGLDKDLAAWAADYAAKVAQVADSHRIGTEAAEKYYASFAGTKAEGDAQIVKKRLTDYFDVVSDLSNQLDTLAGKDKSLSVYEKELDKISNGFDKWTNSAASVAEKLKGQTNPAVVALREYLEALIDKAEALEPALKAAFNDKLIKDFDDDLKKLNETYSDDRLSAYDAQLKKINDDYDEQIKQAEEIWKTTDKSAEAEATLTQKIAETNAARQEAIENNIELAKTGDSLWAGFVAGAKDAAKEMTTLGELGYEAFGSLETAWKDGFYAVFTGDLDSLSDVWDSLLSSLLRAFSDFVAELLLKWAAAELLDMTINVNGSDWSSGLATLGSAVASIFGESTNTYTGAGGTTGSTMDFQNTVVSAAASKVGEQYVSTLSSTIQTGLGYVGVAAGGYGVYSGVKNISEGNYGTGSLQTGLGAVSMYKGAVAADMIAPGTATKIGESIVGYFAKEKATEAVVAKGVETAGAKVAGSQMAGSAYAGPAAAVAIAAIVAYNMVDHFNKDPAVSEEFDKLDFTSVTAPFSDAVGSISGSALEAIPRLRGYSEALYDTSESTMLMTGAGPALIEMFDTSTKTWVEGSEKVNGAVSLFGANADYVSMSAVGSAASIVESFTGVEVSMLDAASVANLADASFQASNQAISENSDQNNLLTSTSSILTMTLLSLGMTVEQAALASDQLNASMGLTVAQQSALNVTMDAANASISVLEGSTNSLYDAAGNLIIKFDETQYEIQETTDKFTGAANGFKLVDKAVSDVTSTTEESSSGFNGLSSTVDSTTASVGGLTTQIQTVATAAAESVSSIATLSSSLGGFVSSASSASDSLRKAVGSYDEAVSSSGSRAMGGIIGRANGGTVGLATGGLLTGGSGVRDDLYLGSVDGVKYLAMGGEFVVNKRATANNRELLEAINDGKSIGTSGSSVAAEISALRAELKASNAAIARNTKEMAKVLTKFDYDGMPAVR